MNNKPLKIVDSSTLIPGPFASYLLQKHLNAQVIKVEDLNQPDALSNMRPTKDGVGLGYLGINKKKSILKVDFRKNGVETLKEQVKDASVFIENFKPGKTFKMGIGFEDLIKANPKLIYCSIAGYPSNHPLAKKSAHDLNILALSGFLDQQLKLGTVSSLPPLLLADMFTAYHTALRILSSLAIGEEGIHLEISMQEALLEAMYFNNYPQLELGQEFSPKDYIMSGKYPCYAIYESKNGTFVAVAAIEKSLWIDFCHHLGHEEWVEKQFDTELVKDVATEIKKIQSNDWLRDDLDFCVTPVMSIVEASKAKYA